MGHAPANAGPHESPDSIVHAHQGTRLSPFRKTMELHTNSSNNTIFADADGDIAYFHANFIPAARSAFRLDQAGGWK